MQHYAATTLILIAFIAATAGPALVQAASDEQPQSARGAATTLVPPAFGTVIIQPSGQSVVSGTAEPLATVDLLDGSVEVGTGVADSAGIFSVTLDRPLAPGGHTLSVRTTSPDRALQLLSDQRVTVSIPDAPGSTPTVALNQSGTPSRILQAGSAGTGSSSAVESAPPPATAQHAGPTAPPASAERTVTVQTGDSLWTIAQAVLGDGSRWTVLYQANRDQIRNPRWIYPGQTLKLPDGAGAGQ
jgi:nucleoid-associated protein YgaU